MCWLSSTCLHFMCLKGADLTYAPRKHIPTTIASFMIDLSLTFFSPNTKINTRLSYCNRIPWEEAFSKTSSWAHSWRLWLSRTKLEWSSRLFNFFFPIIPIDNTDARQILETNVFLQLINIKMNFFTYLLSARFSITLISCNPLLQ